MHKSEIAAIKDQVRSLPAEQRVELIKYLADSLSAKGQESIPLKFGKYSETGRRMATESDFRIAEWHPTDRELNGN
ncbi:MAG: hypothetical protein KF831_02220 [Acidobacteria bacterium]|nr:hypothetical protein [Acidobacteriota bacterium]